MNLLSKMIDNGEEWYRMGNLYVGYACFNKSVESFDDGNCALTYIKQGPIICYKPTFSKVYTRVSNGVEYLENTYRNNSQQVGDCYFQIEAPFIDFVHEYVGNFDDTTKKDYFDKYHIIKLEQFLMDKALENQSQQEEQTQNK